MACFLKTLPSESLAILHTIDMTAHMSATIFNSLRMPWLHSHRRNKAMLPALIISTIAELAVMALVLTAGFVWIAWACGV